ncbi:MAG: CoB--CoM heterodisulfide reductase iron-sulfur subunit A family protein [Chloroflexota bacterium]|nr:CoB--CoM heterodisulfide reductase iron-sulfur subunit A family protein [Chloroflexota bacterium]
MTDQSLIPRALVIGAGIGGMQAALDIANAGYDVVLVERLPSIGGRMAQLSETFPTLDCSQCILTPRTVEVGHHEHIRLLTYSEVEAVEPLLSPSQVEGQGRGAGFRVRIRRHAAYVDWDKCTGCGLCQEKCPRKVPSGFERYAGKRKAIYTLSPQAVPNKPVIDRDNCIFFQRGKCKACERFCPVGAIDYDQEDTVIEERVDAIVLATGYDLYGLDNMPEYGGGKVPDVIDALAFERLLSASGPTAGEIQRPSDGRVPREVVFVQCAGSRDPEKHLPYCSKVCCMYIAKQSILYRHRVHDGQAYIFYIDIRAAGKRYDEFTQRAMEDEHVIYLRGKVSRIFRKNDKVIVWGADTLSGQQIQIAADLVVLAPALLPRSTTHRLAEILGLPVDEHGWLLSLDSNAYPVETVRPGIFLAGAGTGPMDIPETVAHASGAAAQVLKLFSPGSVGNQPEPLQEEQ